MVCKLLFTCIHKCKHVQRSVSSMWTDFVCVCVSTNIWLTAGPHIQDQTRFKQSTGDSLWLTACQHHTHTHTHTHTEAHIPSWSTCGVRCVSLCQSADGFGSSALTYNRRMTNTPPLNHTAMCALLCVAFPDFKTELLLFNRRCLLKQLAHPEKSRKPRLSQRSINPQWSGEISFPNLSVQQSTAPFTHTATF